MILYLLIFMGSGLGGLFRYLTANFMYFLLGKEFPIGTLIVNITGSFIMGLLFTLLLNKLFSELLTASEWRAFLIIGFLGGYTTFSSFSLETVNLIEAAQYIYASLNIILSIILCLGGAWIGVIIGRQL